ncbi:MAG TPA: 3-deoxy-manno-octulosonate cytidylyltransferase [Gemmatimonadaceae bacterium]|nr:3-deoxy-manno-octulosonate cytidylyltransferase [Gemmatimonadaceae bacterium]
MSTLAVIPARLGATRLPRKPLRLLGGVPLVVRVWERVAALDLAGDCIIATDSQDVIEAARAAGAEAVLTSADHASGTDRVAEVARLSRYRRFDTIVNVQGDEPFIDQAAVLGAAAMVSGRGFALGTAAARAGDDVLTRAHVVKVVTADDGRAMYFSRAAIPYLRDGTDAPLLASRVLQHIGVYAYTREALVRWVSLPEHPLERIERLEQLRPLAAGIPIGVAVVDGPPEPGIDTEADLDRANARWTDLIAGRP